MASVDVSGESSEIVLRLLTNCVNLADQTLLQLLATSLRDGCSDGTFCDSEQCDRFLTRGIACITRPDSDFVRQVRRKSFC